MRQGSVGVAPRYVAIGPDGATAFVTNQFSGTVTPISVATNTPGAPIPVGAGTCGAGYCPTGIAITPDGATAYVTMAGAGTTVVPIDLATNTAGTPIPLPLGLHPWAIAIAPNGARAYVTASDFLLDFHTVTPIDVATNTPGSPIPVGPSPNGIAVTPDSTTAYVTSSLSDTVWPIDLATNTTGAPISVGSLPNGIAITPAGAPDVAELLAALLSDVTAVGPGTSLADKVEAAQAAYAAGDECGSSAILGDLINQLKAQRGKKIGAALADQLIADATAIREAIDCSP